MPIATKSRALAVALLALAALPAASASAAREADRAALAPVGSVARASGTAQRSVLTRPGQGSVQEFTVSARGLPGPALYSIFADGAAVGGFAVGTGGHGRVSYSSVPGGQQLALPAALLPVTDVNLVEVKSPAGEVVLSGAFAP